MLELSTLISRLNVADLRPKPTSVILAAVVLRHLALRLARGHFHVTADSMSPIETFIRLTRPICAIASPVVFVTSVLTAPLLGEEGAVPETIRFNEHVRPILTRHCTACHGGVKQAGEVSFVYRDKVLPPDGWIVEPGSPESSVLLDRVTATDPDEVMPPPEHSDPLSPHEIALLRKWIKQGAIWAEHWAYTKPEPQPLPEVRGADWCRQPLDHFILSRLRNEHIEPNPNASPERWLRRVSLDLTGLPPAPEDLTQFRKAIVRTGDAAYANVVDRLLASPHFGERWASVWLDLMRYADSKGLGMDAPRTIWKYRDWVISALNKDLPYDEFTIKQIAGDLLPNASITDQIATAAHRLTHSNEEGGTDDEEFRVAAVLDRVSTTWQTWQGVTFGCVQCHSHPYGPFEHEEFYRFAAFFNNTADCDLNEEWPILNVPNDSTHHEHAAELDASITRLKTKIWQTEYELLSNSALWNPVRGLSASSSNATQLVVKPGEDHDEFETQGTIARGAGFTLQVPTTSVAAPVTAIRLTALPFNPEAAVPDSEWGFVWSHIQVSLSLPGEEKLRDVPVARLIIDEPDPFHDPQLSLNAKSNHGFSAYSRIHYPRQAALLLKTPVDVPPGGHLRVSLKHRVSLLGAFALITRRGHVALSTDHRFAELLTNNDLQNNRLQLKQLQAKRAAIASTSIPVLRERPQHLARPTHVFVRGLFLTKDEQVSAGTPASLPPMPPGSPTNRLGLAHWLASNENPLTARVAVNRLWARLFGTGLVATEEDFGSSGEPPSHPQLLDFLALRFQQEHKWSVKGILREIILSSTYRQSARMRPDLVERDPQNRLLWRGPRHRLPAEMVRDQALAVSGLLNRELYGPPVHPPIPAGVWRPFYGADKWETPEVGDGKRYRRSIYTYTKRSIPYPVFSAFDAPSREFCAPRRLRSNTPLQALMTLNDATFTECKVALAARMAEQAETPREQISHGFLLAICREPHDQEMRELVTLYNAGDDSGSKHRLQTVANVLLNLDEFLTK